MDINEIAIWSSIRAMMDFHITFKIIFLSFLDICSTDFRICKHVVPFRSSKYGHNGGAMLTRLTAADAASPCLYLMLDVIAPPTTLECVGLLNKQKPSLSPEIKLPKLLLANI